MRTPVTAAACLLLAVPAMAARAVPSPGLGGLLSGTWCVSATDCWAVGYYNVGGGVTLNLALHWNGRTWSRSATPNPGGSKGPEAISDLHGIACVSARDCWAVGFFITGQGQPQRDQALHWNGTRWSLVATPSTTGSNVLGAVRCPLASSCWAVGVETTSFSSSAPTLNQVLHWNGRKWRSAAVPQPASTLPNAINFLRAVGCTSDRNCWAVGEYNRPSTTAPALNQALHWNGQRWSVSTTPEPGGTSSTDYNSLYGVSCTSSGNCWAVGRYGNSTLPKNLNQALHWNGRKWAQGTVPDPDGTGGFNSLTAVTCTSVANCWAVGWFGDLSGGGTITNQALHWNGHHWSQSPTPNPGGTGSEDSNYLFAVRCASAALCWAVGDQIPSSGPQVNQALRWNGRRWLVG